MSTTAPSNALSATTQALPMILREDVYQALLRFCELQGCSIAEGVQIVLAAGLRSLWSQDELNSLRATDRAGGAQAEDGPSEQNVRLRAENARLSVENALLHAWIAERKAIFPT
jgi:hypothetical protein